MRIYSLSSAAASINPTLNYFLLIGLYDNLLNHKSFRNTSVTDNHDQSLMKLSEGRERFFYEKTTQNYVVVIIDWKFWINMHLTLYKLKSLLFVIFWTSLGEDIKCQSNTVWGCPQM